MHSIRYTYRMNESRNRALMDWAIVGDRHYAITSLEFSRMGEYNSTQAHKASQTDKYNNTPINGQAVLYGMEHPVTVSSKNKLPKLERIRALYDGLDIQFDKSFCRVTEITELPNVTRYDTTWQSESVDVYNQSDPDRLEPEPPRPKGLR